MGGGLWQQLASAELTSRDECVLSRLPSLVLATAGQKHTNTAGTITQDRSRPLRLDRFLSSTW